MEKNMTEIDNRGKISDRAKALAEQFLAEEKVKKRRWFLVQRNRFPLYFPTQEIGVFGGVIDYLTAISVRSVPYYQTESGISFVLDSYKDKNVTRQISLGDNRFKLYPGEEWLRSD